ncbi:MAG: hypothetical protein AAFO75_02150 [Pseudomonadota bacterium]
MLMISSAEHLKASGPDFKSGPFLLKKPMAGNDLTFLGWIGSLNGQHEPPRGTGHRVPEHVPFGQKYHSALIWEH